MKNLTGLTLGTCLLGNIAMADTLQPPTYVCQRTTQAILIDGKADEADWKAARPTNAEEKTS